jgi:hypothetical protein
MVLDNGKIILPLSDPIFVKCITPETGFSFHVKTRKESFTFNKRVYSAREAFRVYEVCQLVFHQPLHLQRMIKLGNYEGLKELTGEFYLFSNRLEYFIDLDRWIGYSHARGEEVFPKEYISRAIDAFHQMVIQCDKDDPAWIFRNTEGKYG